MGKHSVDIVLQAEDRASKVLEGNLATFKKWRTEYMGIARALAITGVAIRGLEGASEMAVKWRDAGFGEGFKAFVDRIPIIGSSMNRLGENIAELIVNSNAKIAESNRYIKEQLTLGTSLNDLLKQRIGIMEQLNTLNLTPSQRARYDIEQERNQQIELVKKTEALARRHKEKWLSGGEGEEYKIKANALLKSAQEERGLIEKLYNDKISALQKKESKDEIKKTTEEYSDLDGVLKSIAEEIYKAKYGEEELLKLQMKHGLGTGRPAILNMLLEEKKKTDEIIDAEKKRVETEEKIRDIIKEINDEYETTGMNRYQKMGYDLIQAGAGGDIIKTAQEKINELSQREGLSRIGPTPGWAPFESKTLRGITSGSAAINYEAQTANNTREHNKLLAENNRLLKQFVGRNQNTQTIKIADIN